MIAVMKEDVAEVYDVLMNMYETWMGMSIALGLMGYTAAIAKLMITKLFLLSQG